MRASLNNARKTNIFIPVGRLRLTQHHLVIPVILPNDLGATDLWRLVDAQVQHQCVTYGLAFPPDDQSHATSMAMSGSGADFACLPWQFLQLGAQPSESDPNPEAHSESYQRRTYHEGFLFAHSPDATCGYSMP
jgi:hypothetical protein